MMLAIAIAASAAPADLEGDCGAARWRTGTRWRFSSRKWGSMFRGPRCTWAQVGAHVSTSIWKLTGFSFQIHDPAGKVVIFHWKLSETGLAGQMIAGDHASKISFPLGRRAEIVRARHVTALSSPLRAQRLNTRKRPTGRSYKVPSLSSSR